MDKLIIFSGAGMSAESGIKTFRDADGLWEGHDVMQVASPQGWQENKELVMDFYNQRRRQLREVEPNQGHKALVDLADHFDVEVITQNVDDLHERAGSKKVCHLHGELFKVRSTKNSSLVYPWTKDLNFGDCCEDGHQLRPHIVWFGEAVPKMDEAINIVQDASIMIVIGTSLQVYPAAGLIQFLPPQSKLFYVDPHPSSSHELSRRRHVEIIKSTAAVAIPKLVERLITGKE